jgi:monofunctional glycosyltransferase
MGKKRRIRKSGNLRNSGRKSKFKKMMLKVCAALLIFFLLPLAPIIAFRWLPVPFSSFMLQQRLIGLGTQKSCDAVHYHWVSREKISPHVAVAVLAAEDQNFPRHHGFDLKAIVDALEAQHGSGRVRGASTISQQVAKNLFLWPGKTWIRKGLEAYLTAAIELIWPKWRILEVYLNLAQFGPCTFGVEAAAGDYYSTSAARLSAEQGARLASVLPNPARFHPDRPSEYMRERTAWILNQVQSLGGSAFLKTLDNTASPHSGGRNEPAKKKSIKR